MSVYGVACRGRSIRAGGQQHGYRRVVRVWEHEVRREIGERLEHETPQMQARVRQHQVRRGECSITVDEQVEVECARGPFACANAPVFSLDLQKRVQQRVRRPRGGNARGGVEVCGLRRVRRAGVRGTLVHRRGGEHRDARRLAQV